MKVLQMSPLTKNEVCEEVLLNNLEPSLNAFRGLTYTPLRVNDPLNQH